MANLKEIRVRIGTVNSTRQITSAMKMVSASKLRRAQDRIVQLRPYANKLKTIILDIVSTLTNIEDNPYIEKREAKKILLIAVTSNKGLCGGFNSSVVKEIIRLSNNDYKEQYDSKNLDLICVGKKGYDLLKRKNFNIILTKNELFDDLSYNNISNFANDLISYYTSKKYDRIDIIYNEFKNAAVQILSKEQFLPLEIETTDNAKSNNNIDYIFDPEKEEIIKELIPKALKIQFYKSILDSNASENGARMTAMHKATDNASGLLKDLKLQYNKARQASITKEILEIVGGAEALKN